MFKPAENNPGQDPLPPENMREFGMCDLANVIVEDSLIGNERSGSWGVRREAEWEHSDGWHRLELERSDVYDAGQERPTTMYYLRVFAGFEAEPSQSYFFRAGHPEVRTFSAGKFTDDGSRTAEFEPRVLEYLRSAAVQPRSWPRPYIPNDIVARRCHEMVDKAGLVRREDEIVRELVADGTWAAALEERLRLQGESPKSQGEA